MSFYAAQTEHIISYHIRSRQSANKVEAVELGRRRCKMDDGPPQVTEESSVFLLCSLLCRIFVLILTCMY